MAKKIFNVISTVILVVLIALVVFIFVTRMTGNTPTVFGYHVYRVQTDSMVPTLNVGDVILVRDASAENIREGDIITYRVLEGDLAGQTITHRVYQPPEERGGTYYFVTKGDKEGAVPDQEISYDQVEGKYVRTLPWIDKMYTFFLSPTGLITFVGLIIVLFGYEMISLIVSYKSLDEKDEDYYAPPNRKPKHKRKKAK